MTHVTPSARRRPWEERSVFIALILAVLVPGLGHLFQGRFVKGLIYFCGILGLFVWGVKLGEGVVVYNVPDKGSFRQITLHYAAQFGAGAISYPAIWQKQRVLKDNNNLRQLDQPLSASFSGKLVSSDNDSSEGKLEGTVNLKPEQGEYGPETKGTFSGTLDGKPVELQLAGNFYLDRPVAAGFRRGLRCGIAGETDAAARSAKTIVGTIPRPWLDGYGVSPDPDQLQELTSRLGKLHELALVFTWIAGLLNILAVWDCVQGPAYGFGDEGWAAAMADEVQETTNPIVPAPSPKPVAPA